MKLKHLLLLSVLAAILGLLAGAITIAFVAILDLIHEILWVTVPGELFGNLNPVYIAAMTLVGGLLVGLCSHYFGDYPKSLETALETYKKTKKFDYKHIPQSALASFASLGFGASLGPEAALIAIIGGLGTWVGELLKKATKLGEAGIISLSATVGVLFGSPLGAAAISASELSKKRSKIGYFIPSLIAAGSAFWLFNQFSNGGFFHFDFLPYTFATQNIWQAFIVAIPAFLLGAAFIGLSNVMHNVFGNTLKHPIIKGMFGGLILGGLGVITSFALFSGHEAIQEIIDEVSELSALSLFAIALIKVFVTASLLTTGWKGGRFFPLMFAGAALGLGVSQLFTFDPMLGLAVGMSATLTSVLKKPAAALLLLLFFFPVNMYALIVLGVAGSTALLRILPEVKENSL